MCQSNSAGQRHRKARGTCWERTWCVKQAAVCVLRWTTYFFSTDLGSVQQSVYAAIWAQSHTRMLEGRFNTDTPFKYLENTHTDTHVFNTIYVAGKGTSWETHSALYSLRTCDCGGRQRRKGGRRERGKKEAQVETLVFWDVRFSLKYKQRRRKVFFLQRRDGDTFWRRRAFLLHLPISSESFVTQWIAWTANGP